MSAKLGIGKSSNSPKEWIEFMGFEPKSVRHHNLAALQVAAAGRKLNSEMGYDFVKVHFPKWSINKNYKSF